MRHHLRVLTRAAWVACALLLLLPCLTAAGAAPAGARQLETAKLERGAGLHAWTLEGSAFHSSHLPPAVSRTFRPLNTSVDDNDSEDSSDGGAAQAALDSAPSRGDPPVRVISGGASHRARSYRSAAALDPSAARPPPTLLLL